MNFFGAILVLVLMSCHAATASAAELLTVEEKRELANAFSRIDKRLFFNLSELEKSAAEDPLYKAVLWYQNVKNREEGDFYTVSRFVRNNPKYPRQETMLINVENMITGDIPGEDVKDWFLMYPPITIKGLQNYIKHINPSEIQTYLKIAWGEHTFSAKEDKLFYQVFRKHLSDEILIDRISHLIWTGKIANARELLSYAPKGHQALFNARIGLRQNVKNVTALIKAVPENLKEDEGLIFDRMRWRRKKKLYKEALKLLEHDNANRSHPEQWWDEKVIIARQFLAKGDPEKAYEIVLMGDNSVKTIYAEAEWLAGWIALRYLGKVEAALEHFLNMRSVVTSVISKSRGDYWIARCYEEMQDNSRAWNYYNRAAEHTSSFYGQMAILQAGINVKDIFFRHAGASHRQYERYRKSEIARIIIMLSEIKRMDLLNSFALRELYTAENEEEVACLIRLLKELDKDDLIVLLSRRARMMGIELGEDAYPLLEKVKYPKNGDRALILSVIRQESGFSSGSVSPKGARGLMQIMPSTAQTLSKAKRLQYSRNKLSTDMNYNIELGSYYLNRLIKRYEGNLAKVFAAYNGGPNNVRKWDREYLPIYGDDVYAEVDWIEHIPFGETRNYVQRVKENYFIYKRILEKEDEN